MGYVANALSREADARRHFDALSGTRRTYNRSNDRSLLAHQPRVPYPLPFSRADCCEH